MMDKPGEESPEASIRGISNNNQQAITRPRTI